MKSNTLGTQNTATGTVALGSNVSGNDNTAVGDAALFSNVTGSNNIAMGISGGYLITGDNNIAIGNNGTSADSGVVRIGTSGAHTSFFTAGVRGVTTLNNDAIPVLIDSAGQLGTASSSRRVKTDVHDMNGYTRDLLKLRPVTFHYKQHSADRLEVGLIAEEVAEIYPDLVVRGAGGEVETVQYQKLTPMLLNELQKQQEQLLQERRRNDSLESRVAALEAALAKSATASHR
jgi:BMFP domain-containing protein YqiC